MEMRVAPEVVSEALDERDRPALGPVDAAIAGAPAEESEDGADEHIEDRGDHLRVIGQPVAKRVGQGEHPLPDGNAGNNAVHQVRGRIRHASAAAGRADRSAMTRKRQELLLAADLALQAKEATRRNPAFEERPHLALDKARDVAAALPLRGQEGFQICGHDPVEHRLLGLAWTIRVRAASADAKAGSVRGDHGREPAAAGENPFTPLGVRTRRATRGGSPAGT